MKALLSERGGNAVSAATANELHISTSITGCMKVIVFLAHFGGLLSNDVRERGSEVMI